MQHIFGFILRDSDDEIINDEAPGKGSYLGLEAAIAEGQKRLRQNPNIKQINIYRTDRVRTGFKNDPNPNEQGPRQLVYQLRSEIEPKEKTS